jgi:hypothetical protein
VQKSPLPEPKRNGVTAAHAAAAAVPALGPDDGLAGLNLGSGRAAMADVALSARPVVLERSAGTAAAMEAASVRPGRARQTKLVLGAVALVVVVCGIVGISMLKRPAGDTTTSPGSTPSPTTGTADFAAMAAKLAEEEAAAKAKLAAEKAKEAPKAPGEAPADPGAGAARADLHRQPGKRHGKKQPALPPPTSPPPLGTTPPVRLTAAQQAEANRFGGESAQRDVRVPTSSGGVGRSSPAQADISRVISNNKQGIQTCYQRALLRDNSLTHGKINVRVVISVSGKVRNVSLDAPQSFRALEPCIRDVMSRWAFPPSSEEYSTEFPVVLQGNQ